MSFFSLLLLFFSLFSSHILTGSVGDHLKEIRDKDASLHRMKNVDFIYMINLDKRPEKYQKSIRQLHPFGITPYRFSAVNGWELSLEAINDVGVKFARGMDGGFMATSYLTPDLMPTHELIKKVGQTYFVHCCAKGTIGICLSHLSILQDAYDSGYETIWVMEDDIEVLRDPRILPDLIEKLDARVGKENWDVLFTDRDFRNNSGTYTPCSGYPRRPNFKPHNPGRFAFKQQIDKDFRKIGARFGATSMIIRRSGIIKILNFIKEHQIFLPYDMDFSAPDDIQLFTVNEDIISNLRDAISNNGEPI